MFYINTSGFTDLCTQKSHHTKNVDTIPIRSCETIKIIKCNR